MSIRRTPTNVQEILRDMEDRIRQLENEKFTGRFNRLRIGNYTIEANNPTASGTPTQIVITNLKSGGVTTIAAP